MKKEKGEIKRVGDLFAKYKNTLIAPQKTVITNFIEVVSDLLNVELDRRVVSYTPSSQTIFLKCSGVLKSEIKMHQEEILVHLKGRLGPKNAPKNIL